MPYAGFRDDGGNVYVQEAARADPGKAAALRIFARYWGRTLLHELLGVGEAPIDDREEPRLASISGGRDE
ncbi:hypothetical protein [Sphingomonas abietis]|uniref:Uncharacterized protein n=1 Tax=Sphingomonas abietis TaxID=3012344 RepID=A0ABY7NQC1_9SPHN|nr:hypothetical protein [Sphingomonas abietis]WBO23741.1 hypothetical protein PBT88_06360 [Sphingomonas abietis]